MQFLVREGRSNALILELLDITRRSVDEAGPVVGTVLSILKLIANDSSAALALNDLCNDDLSARLRASGDRYITLLFDALLTISMNTATWPAIVSIFHALASSMNSIPIPSALSVLQFFGKVINDAPDLVPVFLEVFAVIVQRKQTASNGFLAAIFIRNALFKQTKPLAADAKPAFGVVLAFIKTAKTAIRAVMKPQLARDELAEVLAGIDLAIAFPQTASFTARTLPGDNQLEGRWTDWLLLRVFHIEATQILDLDRPMVSAALEAATEG
jgi:hypothetical protein